MAGDDGGWSYRDVAVVVVLLGAGRRGRGEAARWPSSGSNSCGSGLA